MNENSGEVNVPSETFSAEETLIENLGERDRERNGEGVEGAFLEDDHGEIMVEVVGSDVFVDGVGGSEEEEGGTDQVEHGESGNLKSDEFGDLSGQVWDAFTENGIRDVERGGVVVNEEDLERGEELSKEEGDRGVGVGEVNDLGTEMGVAAEAVIVECSSRETGVVAEEVAVTETSGVMERGLAAEGVDGREEANELDYLTSGQDVVLDDEGWNPAVEAGVVYSSGMAETVTTQTQFVSEEVPVVTKDEVLVSKYEVQDNIVVNANVVSSEADQSSSIARVYEAKDEGAINEDVGILEQPAEDVGGEIGMTSKGKSLLSENVVKVADVVDRKLHSFSAHQLLNVKTVSVNDISFPDPVVEDPNNASLTVVGEDAVGQSSFLEMVCEAKDEGAINEDVDISEQPAEDVGLKRVSDGPKAKDEGAINEDVDNSEQPAEDVGGDISLPVKEENLFSEHVIDGSLHSTSANQMLNVKTVSVDESNSSDPLVEVPNDVSSIGFGEGAFDQSSSLEMVREAKDESAIIDGVGILEQPAEDVQGEIGMMSKEESLLSEHVAKVTDVVDVQLHSPSAHQMLNGNTASVNGSDSSDPMVEVPNDVSLIVVGGDAAEDKGSFDKEDKVAAVCSVAIDDEVSVLVSADLPADADRVLTVENRVDNVGDQGLTDTIVVESSKIDVAPCTVPKSSDDQTQYSFANEATAVDSKVLTSVVEAPTISDMGCFVASVKESKSVKCENETSGNADKQGVVPTDPKSSFEEACVDEGEDTGMDIDKPVVDSLAPDLGACPDEEGKLKSEGASDNEHTSLPYEASCIKDDDESLGFGVRIEVSECLDGKEADDSTAIGSIAGQEVEKGYTDGEQVDFQEELESEAQKEAQKQTTEAENSTAIDDKIPEHRIPVASVPMHQSFYLQPPENEGEFSVSDLIWGKVRSHPWWPGQIFNPADASEKAMKYHKKDCFLVAYFGDRTFAWNDATVLKPFREHFYQIENHNNSEAFHHAVSCALQEVSRRVELGFACSCIPLDAYEKIKSQVVENTGIKPESSRRYGVDKSASVSSFEPDKLLGYVKSLAQSPYGGNGTDKLELVIAKAQFSSYSRYKGYGELPEFQFSGQLLESDADTSELNDSIEHPASVCNDGKQVLIDHAKLKSENSSSHKRKHMDTVYVSKKEKSLSDLMVDAPSSTDEEDDGPDGKGTSKSVSTTGKKQKALDSVPQCLDKSKSFYAAKVSSAAVPTPKPSFKIGECIRRAASQLTGSPSILKGSNEKFLKVDVDDGQPTGFEVSVRTPGTSPRGRISGSTDHSSLDEMLSQLHLAAQDPMKGYSFLSTIIPFFSSYRTSAVSKSRKQNLSAGRSGAARKRKASNEVTNTPEEFEFDDVNDSYWTDRIIQNYSEEQLLLENQNGGVDYQLVALEPSKPVKSGRKSRKRFSTSTPEIKEAKPAEHVDQIKQDLPTELVLNFAVGVSVPAEMNLNKTFRRFGPLMESETEVDRLASRARVVFKRCSDAEVAYGSAGKFNIFGSKLVNYELNYSPLVSYKPLPLPTLQGPEDAT